MSRFRDAEPRPHRYGMALAGFILGLFGLLVPCFAWLLLFAKDTESNAIWGSFTLLSVPAAAVCSVVGLILSVIAVRRSRGAKFAVAGICFCVLSFLLFGLFFVMFFMTLMNI